MDLLFKAALTMFGLAIMVSLFSLYISSIFFNVKYDKYFKIAIICGGLLVASGITLTVLNLLIHLWRI